MGKRKKKPEPLYHITPKGLIGSALAGAGAYEMCDKVWDELELYCYRNKLNCIVINKDGGVFTEVELVEEK
jgi:hypothetical protein